MMKHMEGDGNVPNAGRAQVQEGAGVALRDEEPCSVELMILSGLVENDTSVRRQINGQNSI